MTSRRDTHEHLAGHGPQVTAGSERGFGLVFAAVFTIIACVPLARGDLPSGWALAVAGVFAALALLAPRTLAPLNRAWFRLGMLLGAVVSPVVLGAIFFTTIAPIGLLMRSLGKDPLRLARDPQASTYWLRREPPGPPPASLERQF